MDSDNRLQQKDIDILTSNLERLEKSMDAGFVKVDNSFVKVNDRLDIMNANFVKKDMFDERFQNLKQEVDELKDSNRWLFRTVATLVLSIIIGGILIIK